MSAPLRLLSPAPSAATLHRQAVLARPDLLRSVFLSTASVADVVRPTEDARVTLGDALSLKEQLLEAYRQRRAQSA